MFFSTYVLGKKGPLAKIWLAAHWDKKLTRNDVKVIDLTQTVVQIVQPSVPIALRTSGELLIGVVRIYALKVKHLLKDATDATMLLRAANVQIIRNKEGGKDSAIAVTMDLVAGNKAEAMLDADFDDIADILKTGVTTGKRVTDATADPSSVLGTAWFTAEPSQFLEENVSSQGDDIARIRAEMRAFGRSESGSKSTSSGGSADKARAAVDVLEVGLPVDDMDLAAGVGLDDLFNNPPVAEDPFEIPIEEHDALAAAAAQPQNSALMRRKKVGISVDATDTVLSKSDFDAMLNNTSDIVDAEPRKGPIAPVEAEHLMLLRTLENQRTIYADVFSNLPNPALREAFVAAINTSIRNQSNDIEATRNADDAHLAHANEEYVAPNDDFQMPVEEIQNDELRGSRKRGRDDDAFSATAQGTLEAFRTHFTTASSIAFEAATKRLQRIDAARFFVDTLALASHGVVEVRQSRPFGEIIVRKTSLTSKPLAAHA